MTVDEDVGSVELCVNLDNLPAGGMEISVEIFLAVMESGAGRRITCSIGNLRSLDYCTNCQQSNCKMSCDYYIHVERIVCQSLLA